MPQEIESAPGQRGAAWFRSTVRASACALVIVFTLLLGFELVQRIAFPWDLYFWPESPFLTNMLKLDRHLPLYSAPADGNSFIYSPGLDYVTYALLKPFGRQLDIRFCRLVTVGIGAAGALCAALAMMRLAKTAGSRARRGFWFAMTWGAGALVLFKNFLAESPHPDNFHALHALLVFWLTLTAVESRRFQLALLTMVVAGVAVLVKQTEALCFLGPAAAFALFNPWGWRRWLALTLTGGVTLGAALWLLWLPEHARLYTLIVPAHQGLSWHKFYYLAFDLLSMQGGLLISLGCASVALLWNAGASARRYLLCWLCIGFFAVAPGLSAYFKDMGPWNNLMLSEVWLMLVVWPVFLRMLNWQPAPGAEGPATAGVADWQSPRPDFCVLVLLLLVVLYSNPDAWARKAILNIAGPSRRR